MSRMLQKQLSYSILDPTGNLTALVENDPEEAYHKAAAAAIMRRHPDVEQVGFLQFQEPLNDADGVSVMLRMAGGEFCGNAAMCAAAFYIYRVEQAGQDVVFDGKDDCLKVRLRVSGSNQPVDVLLERKAEDFFYAGVHMPDTLEIEELQFVLGDISSKVPVVRMEGIQHALIESENPFFTLLKRPEEAEQAVKIWCEELAAEGLGLVFLNRHEEEYSLIPLVFIPGSNTVFWEHSCASGSAAAGMYLARKEGGAVKLSLQEPGGVLRVESNPGGEGTWLFGSVHIISNHRLDFSLNL